MLTLALAKALGALMIAAGVSGLLAPERWPRIVEGLRSNEALTYVAGAFTFALGVAIVIAHNVWTGSLAIIVTLVGWLAAMEGLSLIVAPDLYLRPVGRLLTPAATRTIAAAVIVLGALILAAGLLGRARPVL